MKRNTLNFFALMAIIIMMAACNNDAWDELPRPIASFISEYFPFGEVESYRTGDNGSVVQIKNGATLMFDTSYEWTDINGNGVPLPQNFLYDKLPDILYRYVESIEMTGSVYRVINESYRIILDFHDSQIEYDKRTRTITYPAADENSVLMFCAAGGTCGLSRPARGWRCSQRSEDSSEHRTIQGHSDSGIWWG